MDASSLQANEQSKNFIVVSQALEAALFDRNWQLDYDVPMENAENLLSEDEVAAARQRRLDAMHLQEIEGNPLTAEDVAMFEMFERERWSHEKRIAYILEQARLRLLADAAE